MNQDIIFKNDEGKINIFVNENLSFDNFIEILKNRLERLYIKDDLLKTNVTLNIQNINLDSKKILKIFDVFSMNGSIYIDKIIFKKKLSKNIILHEGNIRSGEIKMFPNNTLLVGNINKGSKVIVNGNLFVIGKVSGSVEFKNIDCKFIASNLDNAFIKICALEKQFNDIKENVVVKVNENVMVEGDFTDGRDSAYGKGNCCYIW